MQWNEFVRRDGKSVGYADIYPDFHPDAMSDTIDLVLAVCGNYVVEAPGLVKAWARLVRRGGDALDLGHDVFPSVREARAWVERLVRDASENPSQGSFGYGPTRFRQEGSRQAEAVARQEKVASS